MLNKSACTLNPKKHHPCGSQGWQVELGLESGAVITHRCNPSATYPTLADSATLRLLDKPLRELRMSFATLLFVRSGLLSYSVFLVILHTLIYWGGMVGGKGCTSNNPIHPNSRQCTSVLSSLIHPLGCIRKYNLHLHLRTLSIF